MELESIVLPRGCRVQGHVLRGGSQRIAGALVAVVGPDCTGTTVTRADGSFAVDDLLPGEYRVRASLPAQPKGQEMVVTAAPDHAANVILRLSSGRTLRGSVSGSDGQPVVGAIVTVRGSGQTTRTDDGGDFLLELLDRAVELQVSLSDRSRSVTKSVPPGTDRVDVELDTPPLCTLTAQVAGLPGKKRLVGALLRLTMLDGDVEGETNTRWVDLPDGELRFPLCPVGHVRVVICCDGYAPYTVIRDFVANEDHTLGEVLLEPGGRVHGIVQDQGGKPVGGAIVLLGEEGDLDLFEPHVRTVADGIFRISGVTSRSSRLVVRAPGFAARSIDLQLPQDVLGSTPLAVVLEPGSTIEVTLEGRREGGIVQLRRQGRLVASTEIDESGRASFTNRSAGTYSVQLFGSQKAPVDVVVGATPTVSVRLP